MLSRFHPIPERNGRPDGRTERRTDRFAISISRVSILTRDKNGQTTSIIYPASLDWQGHMALYLWVIHQRHDILQRQISRKWYKIELYLQRQTIEIIIL